MCVYECERNMMKALLCTVLYCSVLNVCVHLNYMLMLSYVLFCLREPISVWFGFSLQLVFYFIIYCVYVYKL